MGSTKKPTLQDIANLAGVTKVTVSKALMDKEGVSENVRLHILEIANSLNYNNTLPSKNSRSNCTQNIAVLVPELFMERGYGANRLMEKLAENHYSVPDDVSIIGFDDTLYSIISHPQMTAVSANLRSLAENAVTMVFDRIVNPNMIFKKIIVTTAIVERDSVRNMKIH